MNNICGELLNQRLAAAEFWQNVVPESVAIDDPSSEFLYFQQKTKDAIVNYIREFYCDEADRLINVENAIILPGLASSLGLILASCFEQPSGTILTPAPYDAYLCQFHSTAASVVGIPFLDLQKPEFDIGSFQRVFDHTKNNGGKTDALFIQNPQNPLGVYFKADAISAMCDWAIENNLFVIVDESLAHTADWPEGDQRFTSFLKLLRSIATPSGIAMDILLDKIIWIWSAEEDFCLPGVHFTAVFTGNQLVRNKLRACEAHYPCAPLTQYFVRELIDDLDWMSHFQITKYNQLLEGRKIAIAWFRDPSLTQMLDDGVETAVLQRPIAGTAIFISLRSFLPSDDIAGEETLQRELAAKTGLAFMHSGAQLGYTREPGWFRFVVSRRRRVLENALRRLTIALMGDDEGNMNKNPYHLLRLDDTNDRHKTTTFGGDGGQNDDIIGSFEEHADDVHHHHYHDDDEDEDLNLNLLLMEASSSSAEKPSPSPKVTYITTSNSEESAEGGGGGEPPSKEESFLEEGEPWNVDQFDMTKYGSTILPSDVSARSSRSSRRREKQRITAVADAEVADTTQATAVAEPPPPQASTPSLERRSERSVRWVDQNLHQQRHQGPSEESNNQQQEPSESTVSSRDTFLPAQSIPPITVEVHMRVPHPRDSFDDGDTVVDRQRRQKAVEICDRDNEISQIIDQILANAVKDSLRAKKQVAVDHRRFMPPASHDQPQWSSRSDSGLAESGSPEPVFSSPTPHHNGGGGYLIREDVDTGGISIVESSGPRGPPSTSVVSQQKVSSNSFLTTSNSDDRQQLGIEEIEVDGKRHFFNRTEQQGGPPVAKYLSDSGVFVEMQAGNLTLDFPLRLPLPPPAEGKKPPQPSITILPHHRTEDFWNYQQQEPTMTTTIIDSYNSEVNASHVFIEPSRSATKTVAEKFVDVDVLFRDIRVDKHIFAFTDVVVADSPILAYDVHIPSCEMSSKTTEFTTLHPRTTPLTLTENTTPRLEPSPRKATFGNDQYSDDSAVIQQQMVEEEESNYLSSETPTKTKTKSIQQVHHELKTCQLPSDSITAQHRHMLEQQRKVEEEEEDRVTLEHTNITEIEYAGGRVDREYIEKEEEGEFYTTTTTSVGLMMNPPDEYFTRIQLNGRRIQPLEANVSRSTRKVNYENELRRRRYNVEHHTTRRSYGGGDFQRRSSSSFEEEERQEWKRPSRSRTPHQTTTYFVLKKQLDAASEGVKNPPPQQRHSSVGVYGRSMVTDGRGLVERSSQTDDFVDVCSRLRLCSTKMKKPPPASSSAPSADGEELSPVNNYEYLICRNKNHHGQLDHCNPERVYTVARKKRDSDEPKSPPNTPTEDDIAEATKKSERFKKEQIESAISRVRKRVESAEDPRSPPNTPAEGAVDESADSKKARLESVARKVSSNLPLLEEKEDSAGRSGGRHRSRFGGGHSSESPFGRVTVTTTTTTNSNIVDKGIVFERVEVEPTPASSWIVSSVHRTTPAAKFK